MDHRADFRLSATEAHSAEFVHGGKAKPENFDAISRLKELRTRPLPLVPDSNEHRILHISLYCYKSFPVRIFHVLSLKDGIDSHALFFKNNFTNNHLPVTERELGLLRNLVRDIDPHVVTMSIMAPYVIAARQAATEIRKISNASIVVGGKYPTIVPHEALDFADYACKGDGELVLLRMHERLRQGRDFKGIKGLWYRDENGSIVDMDQEHLYQEMDDIPYPAIDEAQMHFIEKDENSLIDPEIYDEEMLVMAGRGCVYVCSFCVNSLLIPMNRGNGRFVRLRSPENVIEEIDYRLRRCRDARFVTFNDEVFGVFDDWVADFAAKYKQHCGLPFECELVPKLIKEKNVKLLADAGMTGMHFGVQSGHDDIRKDIMHRPGTNVELLEKSEILRRAGVKPQYDIILDNPFDTAESLSEALGLLLSFETPINLNTYKMQYFPHYPFTNMALQAGHITAEDVTDEKVAESVLYNMVYRPQFPALNRREYLENCIYLVPWTARWVRAILSALQRRHSFLLGIIVTLLSYIRYQQSFQHAATLVWLRRFYLGLKLLVSGDIRTLLATSRKTLRKSRHYQIHTGRLSAR